MSQAGCREDTEGVGNDLGDAPCSAGRVLRVGGGGVEWPAQLCSQPWDKDRPPLLFPSLAVF